MGAAGHHRCARVVGAGRFRPGDGLTGGAQVDAVDDVGWAADDLWWYLVD